MDPESYIRIRFIGEKWNPISAAIRYETRSWASHVELIKVRYGTSTVADVLGCRWPKGLQHYPYLTDGVTREEWWDGPNLDGVWEWMDQNVGQRYDLSAIFGIALDGDFHKDDRDICSESVMRGSEHTKTPFLNLQSQPVWRVTPRDLLLSPVLSFVLRVR